MKNEESLPRGIQRHRKSGALIVYLTLPGGRPKRRSVGKVTVARAVKQRTLWQQQILDGTYAPKKKRVVVEDLYEPYMIDFANRGGKDAGRWRLAWKHLKPVFGSVPVGDVTTAMISKYVATRREAVAASTVNKETTLLKALFHFGAKQTPAMVERVPAFPSRLKEPAPRKGFITDIEYARLARGAKEPWLRALIAVAYTYGFRKGELLNLRVRQVDLIDKWIELEVGSTKTDEGRGVPMTDEVFKLMVECCRGKGPDDFVFTRDILDKETGSRMIGPRVIEPRKDWYDLAIASGLGHFEGPNETGYRRYVGLQLHDFRRSVPETVCMQISGHKTRAVFERYNIVDKADLVRAFEQKPSRKQSHWSPDLPQVVEKGA
jgi:integrase